MPNINILSPHIADLIAAGEVVERPASVVKELIENSIDAGAHNITLELSCGGMTYIKISDDGSGMSPEDVGICTLRHATSKIACETDLESIGTLGFRGEALAAISAVSRMEIVTRRHEDELGTLLILEASDIMSMQSVGSAVGTVIVVRDLFFNTPARLKFMKSDRAESMACIAVAQKCALAHPEVSIRCIHDGKEDFFTAGDNRLSSVSYSILGREIGALMREVHSEIDGIEICGFICAPEHCRGNRSMQYFFVNGRNIRSLSLQTALENGYKNTAMVGRYPACVLHINISCSAVDVNVHPTKAEVRFSAEKAVFSAVYHAVLSALNPASEPVSEPAPEPKKEYSFERPSAPSKEMLDAIEKVRPTHSIYPTTPPPKDATYRILSSEEYHDLFVGSYAPPVEYKINEPKYYKLEDSMKPEPEPEPIVEKAPEPIPEYRVIGETMSTYILVECGEELIFIDKHATHERIIFDRIRTVDMRLMSQKLIEPIVFRMNSADEDDFKLLGDYGFEVEPFGTADAIIRAIPSIISAGDAISTIEGILENPDSTELIDNILHTIACKAAVKAGKVSDIKELEVTAKYVMEGKVKYCPHGRPVMFKMSKNEMDKNCKRIV